jgi:YidC/Oxa1 family membrane protein insertase
MASTDKRIFVEGDDSLRFSMRLHPNNPDLSLNESSYIEYGYVIHGNDYRVDFDINFVGMKDIIASNVNEFTINWDAHLRQQEKSLKNERMVTTIYYKPLNDDVDYILERKDDVEDLNYRMKWISFKQQFFSATLIADDYFESANIETITNEDRDHYLKTLNTEINIEYNPSIDQSVGMSWYFGPNKYRILRNQKLDLERQIPLGWSFFIMQWINRFAVIPVFNWLESFHINYGIIILILTILLKTLLFPIAFKMYKSQAKIRVLKPEIDEIAKKFPKKEDSVKKQQATMALYKKAGASPMAGCVPMLLQFPILIAMFRFFPASIELRQQSFLWATDLSSYDSILNLGFEIPFYGDHVSLFTLLMTISTLIYTRMNNQTMASTQQMPGMKTMMYIMPIMFLGFFNSYASALSYYYLLANVITFTQMYLFRRFIDEDKIRAKIEQHKKKPVKKSSFQKRMEDMAKQRGVQPKKKK